jgi:hypothetical protein
MNPDDQLGEALSNWLAGRNGAQSGQYWGNGRVDRPLPNGHVNGLDPRAAFAGLTWGLVSDEDTRLNAEYRELLVVGLHKWPRLNRKHKFMATISNCRLGGVDPGFPERIQLGATLKEVSSRWNKFAGRRCLLEPGEHAGREIEIAWRRSDHPSDCSLIPKSGKQYKVVNNTYYTITLAVKPEIFVGGANPMAVFH